MQQKRIKKTGNPQFHHPAGRKAALPTFSYLYPLVYVLRPTSPVLRPPSYVPRKNSAENPAKRISAESEEIPITAQFSPRGGNGAVMGISELERLMGVEPTYAAWEAAVLPMNYSRKYEGYYSRPFRKLQAPK